MALTTILKRKMFEVFLIASKASDETLDSTFISSSYLQVVNQKSPEVAAPSEQYITMSFEDTALNKDATVTKEVPLTLLIEFKQ